MCAIATRPSIKCPIGICWRGGADRTSSIGDEYKAQILMAQQLADETRTATSQAGKGVEGWATPDRTGVAWSGLEWLSVMLQPVIDIGEALGQQQRPDSGPHVAVILVEVCNLLRRQQRLVDQLFLNGERAGRYLGKNGGSVCHEGPAFKEVKELGQGVRECKTWIGTTVTARNP